MEEITNWVEQFIDSLFYDELVNEFLLTEKSWELLSELSSSGE